MPSALLDKIVQMEKFVYFSFYRVSGEEKALYIAANVVGHNFENQNLRNKLPILNTNIYNYKNGFRKIFLI